MNKKIKFGDIFTNGINYWMVTNVYKVCECSCHVFTRTHKLTPIIVDKDENPIGLSGYYDGQVSDIKPYAKFVKSLISLDK